MQALRADDEQPAPTRAHAAELALRRMGAPLSAGALTTLGSSISLALCTFTILYKIGVMTALAIGWSYAIAQTLLPALLVACEPPKRAAAHRAPKRHTTTAAQSDETVVEDTPEATSATELPSQRA